MYIYMQPYEKASLSLRDIQASLLEVLHINLDGSENSNNYQMQLPTLTYISSNVMA